jgi:hypothetical protein
MSVTVTMQRELNDEFLEGVLITAFDGQYGGSWFWATTAPVSVDGAAPAAWRMDGERWLAVRITGDEGSETGNKVLDALLAEGVWVDYECLRVGIQRMLDGDPGCGTSGQRETFLEAIADADAGMIDSNLADDIVQCGVFGEQVYS